MIEAHERRRSMDHAQDFSIAVSLGSDRARIFLCGELDLGSVATLHARFDENFLNRGVDRRSVIMLDLGDVTFCDAVGLHALRDLADKCRRLGTTLRIVNLPPNIRRVMELTDTLDQFNIDIDLRAADHAAPTPTD